VQPDSAQQDPVRRCHRSTPVLRLCSAWPEAQHAAHQRLLRVRRFDRPADPGILPGRWLWPWNADLGAECNSTPLLSLLLDSHVMPTPRRSSRSSTLMSHDLYGNEVILGRGIQGWSSDLTHIGHR
jgi:hypothetical protein